MPEQVSELFIKKQVKRPVKAHKSAFKNNQPWLFSLAVEVRRLEPLVLQRSQQFSQTNTTSTKARLTGTPHTRKSTPVGPLRTFKNTRDASGTRPQIFFSRSRHPLRVSHGFHLHDAMLCIESVEHIPVAVRRAQLSAGHQGGPPPFTTRTHGHIEEQKGDPAKPPRRGHDNRWTLRQSQCC